MSPRVGAAFRRTFSSAWGSRNFRLYLLGQIVSAAGTWTILATRTRLLPKRVGPPASESAPLTVRSDSST